MQEPWIAAFRCFLEEDKIQNHSTLLFQCPWLPVNCSEWDCELTGSIKTNCLSHWRDKINQVFSQIKILQLEQALGSTDPPDKSERNSRQMWFGDKEDPIEKPGGEGATAVPLELEDTIWRQAEVHVWCATFYGSGHLYCTRSSFIRKPFLTLWQVHFAEMLQLYFF